VIAHEKRGGLSLANEFRFLAGLEDSKQSMTKGN
jgi:hypothetical protein